ncbi:MAG: hypothetical protein MJ102_07490 [Clostridia bacterium]|nr:hypothetical protein [Clostridia bacterium]
MYSRQTSGRKAVQNYEREYRYGDRNYAYPETGVRLPPDVPPDYGGNAFPPRQDEDADKPETTVPEQSAADENVTDDPSGQTRPRPRPQIGQERNCDGSRPMIVLPDTAEDGDRADTDKNADRNRDTEEDSNRDREEDGRAVPAGAGASTAPHGRKKSDRDGGLTGLMGLSGLGDAGLEELLLLGVIFLLFSDDGCRDDDLLICLLLILLV